MECLTPNIKDVRNSLPINVATSQKTCMFINTPVRTSNLAACSLCLVPVCQFLNAGVSMSLSSLAVNVSYLTCGNS